MDASRTRRAAPGRQPALRRWDRWLRESLAPAVVALSDLETPGRDDFRWTVEFPYGIRSVICIPRTLIEASAEDFHRTTVGLESFPWQPALEQAGAQGLRLVCPDHVRARTATAV